MKWLSLFWLPLVAGCKRTKFTKEDGMALKNHVIETVTVFQPVACHWQCVDSPLCFSVNIRKQLNGWVTCELNNSSKTADPQDLLPSIGSQYHQMKVSRENPVLQPCQYQQSFCLAIHTLWKNNHGTSTRRLTGFIYEVSKTGCIFSLQVFRNISLPLKYARLPFLAVLECLSELIKPFNSQR